MWDAILNNPPALNYIHRLIVDNIAPDDISWDVTCCGHTDTLVSRLGRHIPLDTADANNQAALKYTHRPIDESTSPLTMLPDVLN